MLNRNTGNWRRRRKKHRRVTSICSKARTMATTKQQMVMMRWKTTKMVRETMMNKVMRIKRTEHSQFLHHRLLPHRHLPFGLPLPLLRSPSLVPTTHRRCECSHGVHSWTRFDCWSVVDSAAHLKGAGRAIIPFVMSNITYLLHRLSLVGKTYCDNYSHQENGSTCSITIVATIASSLYVAPDRSATGEYSRSPSLPLFCSRCADHAYSSFL